MYTQSRVIRHVPYYKRTGLCFVFITHSIGVALLQMWYPIIMYTSLLKHRFSTIGNTGAYVMDQGIMSWEV